MDNELIFTIPETISRWQDYERSDYDEETLAIQWFYEEFGYISLPVGCIVTAPWLNSKTIIIYNTDTS